MKNTIITLIVVILCSYFVYSWSTSNMGNVNIRGWLNVTNASEGVIVGGNISVGGYYIGDGSKLTGVVVTDDWINETGDIWLGNMDAGGYRLTNLGELIVSNITLSGDIIPSTTEMFSIGNETNWIENLFVKNIYTDRITANSGNITDLISGNINSGNIDTENLSSTKGDIANISTNEMNMGGIKITNESEDLILVLTG